MHGVVGFRLGVGCLLSDPAVSLISHSNPLSVLCPLVTNTTLRTALHHAAACGSLEVVMFLVESGGDLGDLSPDQRLLVAASSGDASAARSLLRKRTFGYAPNGAGID